MKKKELVDAKGVTNAKMRHMQMSELVADIFGMRKIKMLIKDNNIIIKAQLIIMHSTIKPLSD